MSTNQNDIDSLIQSLRSKAFDIDAEFNGEFCDKQKRFELDGEYLDTEDVIKIILEWQKNYTTTQKQ